MPGVSEWVLEGTNDDRQDFKIVGTWDHPGRQSWDMASGAAKYPTDLWREGTLTAMCLRCPYGHARIKGLDISEAEKLEGVRLIVTYEDEEIAAMPKYVPAYFSYGKSPLLGDEGEFEGDEVGVVVVADSEEICRKALDLVKVDWEVLPFILDCRDAGKPGAPILRPDMDPTTNMTGNTFGAAVKWEIGNVEDGFKEADHIEIIEYGRPMWNQFRSMPPAYFSYWDDDPWGNPDGEKVCYVTNHAHFPSNGPLVSAFQGMGVSEDRVRALSPYMASRYCDFVEKRGAQLAPVLSKRLGGTPIRMVSTRRQAFDASVPQTFFTVRIGFKNDGTLVAVQSKNVHQVGARGGYGDKTHGHLVLPPNAQGFKSTACPNIYSEMEYYVTNGACTTADPGKDMWEPVNLAFAKIADVLQMDLSEVIMKNVKITQPSLEACMKAGKEAFHWDEKWHLAGQRRLEDGRYHGVACRACWSMTWGMISYNINLRLNTDGKIYMPYSEALIGTYWPDAVQMVIAEEMGMKLEDVIVYYSANYPNWQKGDAADRGSTCTWAAKEAAVRMKERILAVGASMLGASSAEEVDIVDSMLVLKADPSVQISLVGIGQFGEGYCGKPNVPFQQDVIRTMNVDFCEVAVDPETGLVEILDYCAAHDFGKVIRPSSAMGQLEMALIMAEGRALREEIIWDENTGVLLNGNMYDYKIPTALDYPDMDNVAVETRCGGGAYGSTGVAHAHTNAGLVGLAIQNAIGGDFIAMTPYTPDRVLKAMGKIS
ncbi:MAG: molybdopterin-dependent oxidoreductase [Lachnospiraceae bacterium]|jgi:CO/xanthine dehydrogenase Mo-binding subunit|nr:molybdopterin-dependent oxidoreductase [Lachnospiraceae bacterium]